MALKLIQRVPPLLGRYPHAGAARLLSTGPAAQPVCVACLCTSSGGCIRTQGCRKLQQDCRRRSFTTTTTIKEAVLCSQQLCGTPQGFMAPVPSDPAAPTHICRGGVFPAAPVELLLIPAGLHTAALGGDRV
ncbi:hypothetical protein E3U43_014498 [Larimichthys crocea]|uniref:Uncharacterized protein n=1 Tax=Larimichthys crocea TaxID=215358 RepID=A0ACD3QP05_LARCR|nr:hypothetical protein E3U43_014498 [Larimichthys crocea]